MDTEYQDLAIPLTGKNLPPGWERIKQPYYHGVWRNRKRQLAVIASFAMYDDQLWLHVSMSHRRRVPSYEELAYLKRHWIGEDRKAVMVLPSAEEHVNIHPRTLHLFCCIDTDPLPDFTLGSGSI
jgi:hypothetical protein